MSNSICRRQYHAVDFVSVFDANQETKAQMLKQKLHGKNAGTLRCESCSDVFCFCDSRSLVEFGIAGPGNEITEEAGY